jgi:hypothetical protein
MIKNANLREAVAYLKVLFDRDSSVGIAIRQQAGQQGFDSKQKQ